MSARDDYPLLALHADDSYAVPSKRNEIQRALQEIDQLRQWKAEIDALDNLANRYKPSRRPQS